MTVRFPNGALGGGRFVAFGVDRDSAMTAYGDAEDGNSADQLGAGVLFPQGDVARAGPELPGRHVDRPRAHRHAAQPHRRGLDPGRRLRLHQRRGRGRAPLAATRPDIAPWSAGRGRGCPHRGVRRASPPSGASAAAGWDRYWGDARAADPQLPGRDGPADPGHGQGRAARPLRAPVRPLADAPLPRAQAARCRRGARLLHRGRPPHARGARRASGRTARSSASARYACAPGRERRSPTSRSRSPTRGRAAASARRSAALLVEHARANGITRLQATTLPENAPGPQAPRPDGLRGARRSPTACSRSISTSGRRARRVRAAPRGVAGQRRPLSPGARQAQRAAPRRRGGCRARPTRQVAAARGEDPVDEAGRQRADDLGMIGRDDRARAARDPDGPVRRRRRGSRAARAPRDLGRDVATAGPPDEVAAPVGARRAHRLGVGVRCARAPPRAARRARGSPCSTAPSPRRAGTRWPGGRGRSPASAC